MAATRAVPDASTILDRARPRRARRLARLRPLAARRAHPRAVGDGGRRRRSARNAASTSKRSGETTGSWCGFRMWTSRPTCGCSCPIRTRCRRSSSGSSARRRCSRPSSARTPPARCCCPGGAPACARRSGSSASARRTCWPSRRSSGRFRCCSKPIASACAISSTCRRSISTLTDVRSRRIRVATADSEQPSPFAASLLFSYVASFLYDGDAPLAERRAQALAVDQAPAARSDRRHRAARAARRRFDAGARARAPAPRPAVPREEPRRRPRHAAVARRPDAPRNWRRARRRATSRPSADDLVRARRALAVRIGGPGRATSPSKTRRVIATRSACRCRPASPKRCSRAAPDPLGNLVRRYARTHAPFAARGVRRPVRARHGRGRGRRSRASPRTVSSSKASSRRARTGREWTDAGVLRQLRRRSLAKLRHEIEPVDQPVLGRLTTTWQGVARRRHGADALLDVIEQLQGAPLRRVDPRNRNPSRPDRRLRSRRPRRRRSGRRGRLGGRRAARRSRRTHRAVSGRPCCRVCCRRTARAPATAGRAIARETGDRRISARARRELLRPAARGGRRRLPRRHRRGALESRVAGVDHERHVPRAARVHARARAEAPAAQARARRRSGRAASRRRPPKDAGRWSRGAETDTKGRATAWAAGVGAATARPPRRPDARGRHVGSLAGRLRRRLSGAEGDGGKRPHPPRLLRRGPRRDAVRAARRARSASLAARSIGGDGAIMRRGGRAVGDRSGQSRTARTLQFPASGGAEARADANRSARRSSWSTARSRRGWRAAIGSS